MTEITIQIDICLQIDLAVMPLALSRVSVCCNRTEINKQSLLCWKQVSRAVSGTVGIGQPLCLCGCCWAAEWLVELRNWRFNLLVLNNFHLNSHLGLEALLGKARVTAQGRSGALDASCHLPSQLSPLLHVVSQVAYQWENGVKKISFPLPDYNLAQVRINV